MKHKMMLLALAAVSATVLALPAMASAATWDLNPAPAGAFTVSATTTTKLTNTNNEIVECSATKGSGTYSTASSGTLSLTFTGCKTPSFFNTACTSSGAASGEIKTTTGLAFNDVYLDAAHTKLGVTIKGTGAEEHFASFTCSGFISFKVTGTILGEVEKKCGETATSFPLTFEQTSNGNQRWKRAEETGEETEDLKVDNLLNGTTLTGAEVGTGFVTFGTSKTIQCT